MIPFLAGSILTPQDRVPDEPVSISGCLLAYRKARGLRQKDAAEVFGVDPSTLARWERGERLPKGRSLETLEPALNLTTYRVHGAQPVP